MNVPPIIGNFDGPAFIRGVSIKCPTLACALNIVAFLQTKVFKEQR